MQALILTLFPKMFPGTLAHSIAGKALEKGLWSLETMHIRDFANDKHKTVDDKSYGGGTGLVMRPDVISRAIDTAFEKLPNARLIYLTPRGVPLTQGLVNELVNTSLRGAVATKQSIDGSPRDQMAARDDCNLILLCGRYEGVDQRVLDKYQPLEVSIGDYVLSGGEIAAQVLLDACLRLVPGVISSMEATESESFSGNNSGLLEYPQYTHPAEWEGRKVPEILLSGNHQKITDWRREESLKITKARRPDLLNK